MSDSLGQLGFAGDEMRVDLPPAQGEHLSAMPPPAPKRTRLRRPSKTLSVGSLDERAKALARKQRTKKPIMVRVNLLQYEQLIGVAERFDRTVNEMIVEAAMLGLRSIVEFGAVPNAEGHVRVTEMLSELQHPDPNLTFGAAYREAMQNQNNRADAEEIRATFGNLLPASAGGNHAGWHGGRRALPAANESLLADDEHANE